MTLPLKYQLDKKLIEQIRQDERNKALDEVEKMIDEENIDVSNAFFNDRCENCNKNIEPSIHHFIDYFYKGIKQQLKEMREK